MKLTNRPALTFLVLTACGMPWTPSLGTVYESVDGVVGYGAAFSKEEMPASYVDVESDTALAGMMP